MDGPAHKHHTDAIEQSDVDDHQHYYNSDFKIAMMMIEENRKYRDQFAGQHDRHVATASSPVTATSSAPDSITFTGPGVPSLLAYINTRHTNIAPTIDTAAPTPQSPPPRRARRGESQDVDQEPTPTQEVPVPAALFRDMLDAAENNPYMPLKHLRNRLLATATKQRLQYPSDCFYTVEQMFMAIDQVIMHEAADDSTIKSWLQAEGNNYPTSAALRAPRVQDPGTNLHEVNKESKRAILKQRACDIYRVSNNDQTAIVNKLHYYVDYMINRDWQQEVEEVQAHLGMSDQQDATGAQQHLNFKIYKQDYQR